MKSIQIVGRIRWAVVLTLVLSFSVMSGCGKSGGDSKKSKPKNTWDEMRWDRGEWGAIESQPYRPPIA